jgi:hypothetical protein
MRGWISRGSQHGCTLPHAKCAKPISRSRWRVSEVPAGRATSWCAHLRHGSILRKEVSTKPRTLGWRPQHRDVAISRFTHLIRHGTLTSALAVAIRTAGARLPSSGGKQVRPDDWRGTIPGMTVSSSAHHPDYAVKFWKFCGTSSPRNTSSRFYAATGWAASTSRHIAFPKLPLCTRIS